MSNVVLKRGVKSDLSKLQLQDGLLSFTTDEGRIYLDFYNQSGQLVRQPFYAGTLTIGDKTFNGTEDVTVDSYDGSYNVN